MAAGEAGADTTTKESVRLVSDLLARRPLSWDVSADAAPEASMEQDSLDSPMLPPPMRMLRC